MFREFVYHKRKTERDREHHLSLLWHAAALNANAAAGKLQSLETMLQKVRPFATQGESQQREVLGKLAAAYGLRLGKTKLIRKAS